MIPQQVNKPKILIAANWKMNTLPSECRSLAIASTDIEWPDFMDVVICAPFTHLVYLQSLITDGVLIGAQNCHEKSSGPYTGQISTEMLKDLKCTYVILGHSESRAMNPEEDKRLSEKIISALHADLKIIYCCGESLTQRESGKEFEWVASQLKQDIFSLSLKELKNITIAYEPIWAIGTGKHATPEQAQTMHTYIRNSLTQNFDLQTAEEIGILYGGSVNANNVKGFSTMSEIDGVLVGGASLKPDEFKSIIQSFATNKYQN